VGTYETEALVLRAIRYSEADSILALLTLDRGRVSAIAKGARRPKSKLGGRLQPGVRARVTLHEGRGEVQSVRGASLVEPNAGLWVESYRLLAAGAVLETALRALPDDEPSPPAYNLTARALAQLAATPPRRSPPRLDPTVLSYRAKLLVTIGLLPQLGGCVSCGAGGETVGFSARLGGTLCAECATSADRVDGRAVEELRRLLAAPLAEAGDVEADVAAEIERLIGDVLSEHLGVRLRSAAPG
jgi:DNA repair protein RecO (recombination protein O)